MFLFSQRFYAGEYDKEASRTNKILKISKYFVTPPLTNLNNISTLPNKCVNKPTFTDGVTCKSYII